jgi:hypothetical protein
MEGAFQAPVLSPARVPETRTGRRELLTMAGSLLVGGVLVALLAWRMWPAAQPGFVATFSEQLPEGLSFRNSPSNIVAISRDARHVVLNVSGSAGTGLYLRSLDGSKAGFIAGTEGSIVGPFFSPDGQSIAYFQGLQLRRLPIEGGAAIDIPCSWGLERAARLPQLPCPGLGSNAEWTGDFILAAGNHVIWRIPAGGGERTPLI